jgi:glycosyltransferase involved in cell wall biosynthesis
MIRNGVTPFATFVLPTYNQESYIEASLRSVLWQDCPASEVLIADDCSADRTFEIMERVAATYDGPHMVDIRRNPKTLGSGNVLSLARRASSRRVVVFHGDDIARPGRASRLVETLVTTGSSLVSSNALTVDADGKPGRPLLRSVASGFLNVADLARGWNKTQTGATHAFDRSIVEEFLPWSDDAFWYAGDHVLPFRAALKGGCYFLDEILLDRRQHATNQGREIRRSQDPLLTPLMKTEWMHAHYLATRSFMLRDLDAHVAAFGDSEVAREGRKALVETIDERLTQWSRSRVGLLNSGLRPHWAPQDAEFDSSSRRKILLAANVASVKQMITTLRQSLRYRRLG